MLAAAGFDVRGEGLAVAERGGHGSTKRHCVGSIARDIETIAARFWLFAVGR